jgi:hypothetical protein
MSLRYLAEHESACKPVPSTRAASLERAPGPLERFATLAGAPVPVTTAQFGRTPVREAAYRLRARRGDLDFKLSWRPRAQASPSVIGVREARAALNGETVAIAECEAWIAGCRVARRETALKLIGRKG